MEQRASVAYVQEVFRRKWLDDPEVIEEWKHLKEVTAKEIIDQAAHLVYMEFANQGDAAAMNCLAIDFGADRRMRERYGEGKVLESEGC